MGNFCISPLRRAIHNNDVEEVRRLMDDAGEGAPDQINEDYTTDCVFDPGCLRIFRSPLHTAISNQQEEMVEVLFQYGAEPNAASIWAQTGLHKAGRMHNLAIAKLCIKYGTDLYQQDDQGKYPIHSAALSSTSAQLKNIDVLRYFLEEVGKPGDVHLKDKSGFTPLHCAAHWDNPVAAQYLIDHGAELEVCNDKGNTPLQEAKPNSQVWNVLQTHAESKS